MKEDRTYPFYIFDLDGTIADTLESIAFTCNQVLAEHGFSTHPTEAYKTFAGDAVGMLIERALISAGDTAGEDGRPLHYESVFTAYRALFEKTCTFRVKPYTGMPSVLEQLKSAGARLAVLTNKRHEQALDVVKNVYGERLFERVLGEGSGFARKPSPEGALYLASFFGAKPEQCVYIGDTNTDMKTGLAAGMHTVGVTWGFRSREELEAFSPAEIIERPEELLDITLH